MQRKVFNINQDWLFSLGEFNYEVAELVCLPHSVQLTPAISSGCRNYQGLCSYKKDIEIPESYKDKKVFIEFEGAMGVTELYVNNILIKTHVCGYTPLVADISEHLIYGRNNTVLLKLDNSDNEDVPPGKAQGELDFTYDGGLYREARIIVTDKLYITNPLLANVVAGGGIFVSYKDVSEDRATVHVKTHVKNETSLDKSFEVLQTLFDEKGDVIAKESVSVLLEKGKDNHYECDLEVLKPMLWSPETPFLYTLKTEIIDDNTVCDIEETKVGIRTFEFTYDKGLIFNGVPRRISGANYHQTHVYIGNAMPNSMLRRDAMKLREMGMKNIRSHYPFGRAFTNACNELGLTLIVCNPGWQWFKEGVFVERAYQNLRDIVRWQRNNPSIIIWEPILNETHMPAEFQLTVHNIVHEEYPYSPCYTASDFGPTDMSYREFDPGMLQPGMEGYNDERRSGSNVNKPLWIREYNDSPDNWTDHNCSWRSPRGWGDVPMVKAVERMLGFDPQCQSNNYINIFNKKNICGYGIWPGIEHNRGYHINPCWGGFFDLYRIPKFTYHFMKSQSDIEEVGVVLFIANWWSELSPWDVSVYSNAQKVRLYHDGELVDELEPDKVNVPHPPFTFKGVRERFKHRDRSTLKAEAIVDGVVVATVEQKSPGVPTQLKLEADFMGIPLIADGSDIVMVYCKMLDSDGNVVPMTGDRHPIIFSVDGPAEIVGDHTIGANPICTEAGIIGVMIRSKKEVGKITVRAKMLWEQNYARIAIREDNITFESVEKV